MVHDWAVDVDRDARTVRLAGGAVLPYDKLILSPGIDFVDGAVPGWSVAAQNAMPHAYKAGSQSELLKAQVMACPRAGLCHGRPAQPLSLPAGPLRAGVDGGDVLSRINPTAKILIADPKPKFSKQALFEEGWRRHYSGMIERIGPDFGGENVSVDPAAMTVDIDGMVEQVDVCNVIPAQKAGRIADMAGVTDGRWAPVNPADMSSTMDRTCMCWAMRPRRATCPNPVSPPIQPGQGLRDGGARGAHRLEGVPGQVHQYLLVAHRRG